MAAILSSAGSPAAADIFSQTRATPTFRYVRAYFPRSADPQSFARGGAMSRADLKLTGQLLQTQVDALVRQARALAPAISLIGAQVANAPFDPQPPERVTVEVVDDGNPWAHAVNATTMAVGARTIRGMMMGALKEGVSGDSFEGMLFGLGGARSLDDDRPQPFDPTGSEQILKVQLDVIERGRAQGLMSAVIRAARGDDGAFDHERQLLEVADDYISGRRQTPIETVAGLVGSFEAFVRLYKPAERFVLAHEIGHMALRHAEALRTATSCADLMRLEDEADIFAIALLALSPEPGDQDLLTRLQVSQFFDSADIALGDAGGSGETRRADNPEENPAETFSALTLPGYGFDVFVGKALEYAGLASPPGQTCQPRTAAQRLQVLAGVRRAAQAIRWSALEKVRAYETAHPPSTSYRHSLMVNGRYAKPSAAEEADIGGRLTAACHASSPGPVRSRRAIVKAPPGSSGDDRVETVYSVHCNAPTVTLQLSADDKALLGAPLLKRIDDAYAGKR